MDRNEFAYRIVNAISSVLKERHGEITRACKTLGHGKSYLRGIRRRTTCENVKLGKAGAFLEVGEIPPSMMWTRAFPEDCDPLVRFRSEAQGLERRFRLPKILAAIREHHAAGVLRDAPQDTRETDINELWKERISDPARAGRRAASLARYATERPFVARALGVWGAVLRIRGDLNTATVVLGDAIDLAKGYPRILAELAQRAAYVVSQRARHREAVDLAERAIVLYVRSADLIGAGRALVDSGSFLDYCGEKHDAIDAYSAALEFLPESEAYNRYVAHHGLAVISVALNQLREADLYLRKAVAVPTNLPEIEEARFFWLRARIAQASEQPTRAAMLFEKALSLLAEFPVDYSLAATELVLLKLRVGESASAALLARKLTIVALKIDNELVQASVANLILAARQDELRIKTVERALCKIEEAGAGSSIPRPPITFSD